MTALRACVVFCPFGGKMPCHPLAIDVLMASRAMSWPISESFLSWVSSDN